ncbi:unnamed protein product [Camellia sinensis]
MLVLSTNLMIRNEFPDTRNGKLDTSASVSLQEKGCLTEKNKTGEFLEPLTAFAEISSLSALLVKPLCKL